MKIVIIDYGAGNIKSIQFALNRLGYKAILTNEAETIKQAHKVIFPGVGEAGHAMEMLKTTRLDQLIPTLNQPVLGICLGMQLMCNYTEESNTKGLGIFNVDVKRFSNAVKVPQMGWNKINHLKSQLFEGINEGEYMYLVHSYYAEKGAQTIAKSHYDINYSSALKHKNFYGVQFHPEKSSTAGEKILNNFLHI